MNSQSNLASTDKYELTILLLALHILSIELAALELEAKQVLVQLKKNRKYERIICLIL